MRLTGTVSGRIGRRHHVRVVNAPAWPGVLQPEGFHPHRAAQLPRAGQLHLAAQTGRPRAPGDGDPPDRGVNDAPPVAGRP
jgi:hypothetical protein